MTEDRDATSILVWNGRVSRTRRASTEGPRSRPVHRAEHEQNVDDHEERGGSGVEKPGAGEDDERDRDPDSPGARIELLASGSGVVAVDLPAGSETGRMSAVAPDGLAQAPG